MGNNRVAVEDDDIAAGGKFKTAVDGSDKTEIGFIPTGFEPGRKPFLQLSEQLPDTRIRAAVINQEKPHLFRSVFQKRSHAVQQNGKTVVYRNDHGDFRLCGNCGRMCVIHSGGMFLLRNRQAYRQLAFLLPHQGLPGFVPAAGNEMKQRILPGIADIIIIPQIE